jgi:hypothetical protein
MHHVVEGECTCIHIQTHTCIVKEGCLEKVLHHFEEEYHGQLCLFRICKCMNICIFACTIISAYVCMHTFVDVCVCIYINTYVDPCKHTNGHTHTHTQMHVYIYTHMYKSYLHTRSEQLGRICVQIDLRLKPSLQDEGQRVHGE